MHKAWKYIIVCLLILEVVLICIALLYAPYYLSQTIISFRNLDLESLIFFEGPLAAQFLTGSILVIGMVLLFLGVILFAFWLDKCRYGFPIFDPGNNEDFSIDGMD